MTTVHEVVERTYRQYLNRADDRALDVRTNGAVSDSSPTIQVHLTDLTAEEQALIGVGAIIENHKELIRITSVDESTGELTVVREVDSTTAESIADGDLLRVSPPFNRLDVFNAVADSIRELWPDLYGITSEILYLEDGVNELDTTRVAGILDVRRLNDGEGVSIMEVKGSELAESGFGFIVPNWRSEWSGLDVVVRAKTRPTRPSACTDTLASLGVDDDWVEILTVSATAKMVPGREIDRTTIEYLTEAIEAQGIRIGDQFNLAASLLSLRENLIEKHQRGLLVDEGMRVEYTQVL